MMDKYCCDEADLLVDLLADCCEVKLEIDIQLIQQLTPTRTQ